MVARIATRRSPTAPERDQASGETLADFDPTANAGRALYLLFAIAVVLSHAFILGGFDETPRYSWSNFSVSFGTVGVAGFFVFGGFLLTSGLARRPSAGRLLWSRVLRLAPLIWIASIATALVIAPLSALLSSGSLDAYRLTGPDGAVDYVWKNLFIVQRQWTVGTTLVDAPFAVTWNGSLWTMASLFLAYLVLAGLVAAGLVRGRRWLAPAVALMCWLMMAGQLAGIFDLQTMSWITASWQATLVGADSLQLISLFLLGSTAYLYRDRIPTGPAPVLIAIAVFGCSCLFNDWHQYGGIAFGYLALVMLVRLPWRLRPPLGALSFGIYVWAFPLEQLAAVVGLNQLGYGVFAAWSVGAAGLAGLASYRFLEQPTMRLTRWIDARLGHRPAAETSTAKPPAA